MLKSFPKCYLFTGPWKPGGEAAPPLQIFAKVNLLPIDNYSEKKKNTNQFKFRRNYW